MTALAISSFVAPIWGSLGRPFRSSRNWHESSLYTKRERAALVWTEALTRIAETHAPDATYDEVRRHFEDKELVDLTTLIGLINLWNRLAIGFRYQHPVE